MINDTPVMSKASSCFSSRSPASSPHLPPPSGLTDTLLSPGASCSTCWGVSPGLPDPMLHSSVLPLEALENTLSILRHTHTPGNNKYMLCVHRHPQTCCPSPLFPLASIYSMTVLTNISGWAGANTLTLSKTRPKKR